MEDRRRFPRLDSSLSVAWEKIPGGRPSPSDVTKNVSNLGICLIVYEELEPGIQISMSIELPDKKIIVATGRVVWCQGYRLSGQGVPANYDVGVEFLDIKAEDRRVLKLYVLFPKG